MGWFKLTAKQRRLWARMTGTLNDTITIEAEEAEAILRAYKIPNIVIKNDQDYVCPTIAKVSELMMRQVWCNPFYGRGTMFLPDGNCVRYARKTAELMRGYAFGVMTVRLKRTPYQKKFNLDRTLHRMNVFINNKREVVAWEPQICDCPGSGHNIQSILTVHMGVGLENVGDHPEQFDAEGKKRYTEYKGVF